MGGGRMSSADWGAFTRTHTAHAKTVDDIYKSRGLKADFDPKKIKMRESCDSTDNPNSTPVIVGLDVTGSMSSVLDAMARKGLGTLAEEIYNRKPISDPHIMYMGVGDVIHDRVPLQCTQFEADIRIAEQLKDLYLERGGGGNNWESYNLPWYFAAMKTKIDCFDKRGKRGYLFTVGDEETPENLTRTQIMEVFGDTVQESMTNEQLLAMVSRMYNVYHIIVNEGSHYQRYSNRTDRRWRDLLGQNVYNLSDHTKLSEVIVSIIQRNEGEADDTIIKSWDGSTAVAVSAALSSSNLIKPTGEGIVLFE